MSPAAPCDGPAKTAGFTLIEVLVALAVMAISLAAIGSVTATASRGVLSLERHVALMETARTVAATLPQRSQPVGAGLTGEIYGHRWRVDAVPYTGGGIAPVPDSPWAPETLKIRVQSPAGTVVAAETVRLRRRAAQ